MQVDTRESGIPMVVVTGGPGAGKTAILEVIQRHSTEHIHVLPEAAGIIFGGGFPRKGSDAGRRAAQRAIFAVQRELERFAIEEEFLDKVARAIAVLQDALRHWAPDTFAELDSNVASSAAARMLLRD